MKTATVDDTCYFMGGYTRFGGSTNKVYSVSLSALTSQLLDAKSINQEEIYGTCKCIELLSLFN